MARVARMATVFRNLPTRWEHLVLLMLRTLTLISVMWMQGGETETP